MTSQLSTDPRSQTPPPDLFDRLVAGDAVAWAEDVVIPTYEPHPPSRLPMYLDHRVYQGSSGRVYPLPFVEGVAQQAVERSWRAIHLENRYLRLTVLPELGGRIHTGYDKTTGYDFFYRNEVIKPALVGLAGPWISGGVEFNWPQHHRPATYLPMEAEIEHGDDGSVTVWCSDHDPFTRMSETHGIRLYRDRAYVEVVVRLNNRTDQRQTFLWWANAAVRVHERYQSFFPQDVRYVADHARRAITAFPAADRPYYQVDYPARAHEHPGADRIDFYRNIPVPTSYMVVDSDEAFFGGYDHAAGAGVVHWADRRISPGKKQWTWGDSPFGHAWDRQLTDSDGPYVELMAGVFTDNQPDFSWLMPGEVRRFSQFWYPIPAIGIPHAANRDAALHVDLNAAGGRDGDAARIEVSGAVTRAMDATLRVTADGVLLAEHRGPALPGTVLALDAEVDGSVPRASIRVELLDGDRTVLGWRLREADDVEPWTASEPPRPEDVASVEELYLTGLHLQQYRHPTRSPIPYWREALRRDAGHSRTNLAIADRAFRSGDYATARRHAEAAIARVTVRNENPQETEPYYLLGLILQRLGLRGEAVRWFAKASWDRNWAVPAGVLAARNALLTGDPELAEADVALLIGSGAEDPRLHAVRVVALRRLGRRAEATAELAAALAAHPLDDLFRYLADGALPDDAGLVVDLALELEQLGETEDAVTALRFAATFEPTPAGNVAPVAHYLRARILDACGDVAEATAAREAARSSDSTWCFPCGLDAHDALVAALHADPDDDVAAELLGMLLYDAGRRQEALELWKRAIGLGAGRARVHRNAGLASFNVLGDEDAAWEHYVQARRLDPQDARLLFEQDQLAARLGHPEPERLERLEGERALVLQRDDLVVQLAQLLTGQKRASEALQLLESRSFQPWEGGEGKTLAAWDAARSALGMPQGVPPESLGEARPEVLPPQAVRADGRTDYFATSLPELLLFHRPER
jgi:tetratricopeptide (TPR) repeat protein